MKRQSGNQGIGKSGNSPLLKGVRGLLSLATRSSLLATLIICVIGVICGSTYAGSWPDFSNGGGSNWNGGYYRPVSVTNSTGAALTDYQVAITPFTDANFINNTGLVGSWHFSEGSGITATDMSGNGNNGTFSTSVTGTHWTASGRFGNGGSFNGTDEYVTLPQVFSGHDCTVEFWVKRENGATYTWPYILANNIWGGFGAHGHNAQGNLWIGVGGNSGIASGDVNFLPAGQWVYVVYTRSDQQRLYRNGVFYGGSADVANSWGGTTTIGGPMSWNGSIDEVRIYNRALTAAEITTRYNYYTTKLKGDYSDLRFTQALGGTELSYWQETDNKFWVKVPNLPTGTTPIYMYYGNVPATSSSSTTNSFIREVTSLVGSWSFSEGAGATTADMSGNNNTGTWNGTGAHWAAGKFGNGGQFNGTDDYMSIPSSATLNLAGDFTIEIWYKPLRNPTANDQMVSKYDAVANRSNYELYYGDFGNNIPGARWTYSGGAWATLVSNFTTVPGNWYHAVFVYSATLSWFMNGVVTNSGPRPGIPDTNTYPLYFSSRDNGSQYFSGLIDEVHVYNRALTQAEITDLYNNYGYTTLAYPGRVLVRKYALPEPSVAAPGSESPCYTGSLVTVAITTNWTSLIAPGQKVAMGQSIAQAKFTMAVTGTTTAHWKRFRIDKYCKSGQALIPDDKIVVQVWMETNGDGFFDAGDQMLAQGTFTNNTCYLNMNRWLVTTTPKTYYIVYKYDANCGGGQFAGVNIGWNGYLEFDEGIAAGVPP